MAHAHGSAAEANRGRLLGVFLLTLIVFMIQVARPATAGRTFGSQRLEILAAVHNAVLLFGVAAFDELCPCLSGDFDIEHSTFQLETSDRRRLEDRAHA